MFAKLFNIDLLREPVAKAGTSEGSRKAWSKRNSNALPDDAKPMAGPKKAPKPKASPEEIVGNLIKAKPEQFAKAPAQPQNTPEELWKAGAPAVAHLKEWLNLGKGIISAMGGKTMDGTPDVENLTSTPGVPQLYIAPLKGMKRATEKVMNDYGGDWSKLLDIARCSVAVDTLEEVQGVVQKLNKSGMVLAKFPKNRFKNPTEMGYRDLMLNVKAPNGHIMEVQVHLKGMLIAKDKGHHSYETTRTIEGKYGPDKSKYPEDVRQTFEKEAAVQLKLYNDAWEQATK